MKSPTGSADDLVTRSPFVYMNAMSDDAPTDRRRRFVLTSEAKKAAGTLSVIGGLAGFGLSGLLLPAVAAGLVGASLGVAMNPEKRSKPVKRVVIN